MHRAVILGARIAYPRPRELLRAATAPRSMRRELSALLGRPGECSVRGAAEICAPRSP